MSVVRTLFRTSLALVVGTSLYAITLSGAPKDDKAPEPAGTPTPDPATTGYQMPPKDVAEVIDQPQFPDISVSPTREWLAELIQPSLPGIADLATPELKLAGLAINPDTGGQSRPDYATGITLRALSTDKSKDVTGFPHDARIVDTQWSPDGKRIACSLLTRRGVELWLVDVIKASAERACGRFLVDCMGSAFVWSGNAALICKLVPATRRKPPQPPETPAAPVVMETGSTQSGGARTYQGLLANAHDEALFEYYCTSQLASVALDGSIKELGEAALFDDVAPSPNGECLLVSSLHRPWSYLVPAYFFGRKTEVWDKSGKPMYTVGELPLMEGGLRSFDAVKPGRRHIEWRADAKATLCWVEAQDGGDPSSQAEHRDVVYTLAHPFKQMPTELLRLEMRLDQIQWGSDDLALVSEGWFKTRKARTWLVAPGRAGEAPRLLFDRRSDDLYNDPGNPATSRNESGQSLLLTFDKGKQLYLFGKGASPKGFFPFIDTLDLASFERKRVWQCEGEVFEMPMAFVDVKAGTFLTRRESPLEPPNWFRREFRRKETLVPLTKFVHPTPGLKDIQKEILRYERADGVPLSATLYTPAGYKKEEAGPLPTILWAYPEEYVSADTAGQMRTSPWLFARVHPASPLMWLVKSQGYAVLLGPSMPIVGNNGSEPNDTFISQLVANAEAAVKTVVEKGVTDPAKIVVAGQSYGAFMTVNLLAHTDLFVAGIAQSGAYNRTLTPFGFQSEQRSIWEARDVYMQMSPFLHADRIKEPLLLMHGQADDNPGTHTMQSERLYQAIMGNGGTARLCLLPLEGHGSRARESLMHSAWEMGQWLKKYAPSKANMPQEPTPKDSTPPKKSGTDKAK